MGVYRKILHHVDLREELINKKMVKTINYRRAQRKSGIPYTGTHILRHGKAKLARQIGGGLDAVLAMTGHKDLKLADHYSKSNEDDQKHFSEMIMKHIRKQTAQDQEPQSAFGNVIRLRNVKIG